MSQTTYSIKDTADLFGLPLALVERRIRDGRLPVQVVDGEVRITTVDALEMMAEEEERQRLMREIYQEHEEIGDFDSR